MSNEHIFILGVFTGFTIGAVLIALVVQSLVKYRDYKN